MTRKTYCTLLMVSWICMFVAVLSSFLANLSAWASFIITLILALNTEKLFDAEWTKNLKTPLWIQCCLMILAGIMAIAAFILNITVIGAVIGIPLIILAILLNIGIAIWQLVLWNKVKDIV